MSDDVESIETMVYREDLVNIADNPMSELTNLSYWSMLGCTTCAVLALLLQMMIATAGYDFAEFFILPTAVFATVFVGVFGIIMVKVWLASLA